MKTCDVDAPVVAIFDPDGERHATVTAAVRALGARPVSAIAPDETRLIVCHGGEVGALADRCRTVPVIVYDAAEGAQIPRASAQFALPDDAAQLRALLEPWVADPRLGLARLAAHFPEKTLDDIVDGFRARLAALVDGGPATKSPAELHKLAGIAGMLGFRRLSACAERWSVGDESIAGAAFTEARLALESLPRTG